MLPAAKSNRVTVDRSCYRYIVSESGAAEGGVVLLAVTVQLPAHNGTYLRVLGLTARRLPEDLSKFYAGRTLGQVVRPRHAARLIRLGLARGWEPKSRGPAVFLQISDSELFAVGHTAQSPMDGVRPQQNAGPSAGAGGGGTTACPDS